MDERQGAESSERGFGICRYSAETSPQTGNFAMSHNNCVGRRKMNFQGLCWKGSLARRVLDTTKNSTILTFMGILQLTIFFIEKIRVNHVWYRLEGSIKRTRILHSHLYTPSS